MLKLVDVNHADRHHLEKGVKIFIHGQNWHFVALRIRAYQEVGIRPLNSLAAAEIEYLCCPFIVCSSQNSVGEISQCIA